MKINKPKNIAICLNSSDLNRALHQKKDLSDIESKFDVEWDLRAERFTGDYSSFSQMINESILCTDSEFMVFINPKSQATPDDIYEIIDDLCNGYAFSCTISFGLWGATKQLFKEIGMLDERFIGGGYEDNDFMIRLKQRDLAISYGYDHSRYIGSGPGRQINESRVISASTFYDKWIIDNGTCWKSSMYGGEKQLNSSFKSNNKISKSWMRWKDSKIKESAAFRDIFTQTVWKFTEDIKEIKNQEIHPEFKISDSAIRIETNNDGFATATHWSETSCRLSISISQQTDFIERAPDGISGVLSSIESNTRVTWKWRPDSNILYSIRIAHAGRMIYSNDYVKIPTDLLRFSLKSKQYIIPEQ